MTDHPAPDPARPTKPAPPHDPSHSPQPHDHHHDRDHPKPDITRLLRGPLNVRSFMLTGLFLLALLYTLYLAKALLVPIVFAILLTVMLRPIVAWLHRRLGLPPALAALIVIGTSLGGLGFAGYALSAPASAWAESLPTEMQEVERKFRGIREHVEGIEKAGKRIEEMTKVESGDGTVEVRVREPPLTTFFLGQTWYLAANFFLTVGLLYFLLASDDLFMVKLVRVIPRLTDKKRAVEIVQGIQHDVALYIVTITLVNAGLGTAVGLTMWGFGLPNPALWGVMAAMLNFIPWVGALTGIGILGIVSLTQFEHAEYALLVPAAYFALTAIEGSFITPMILGRRLVLNPVVIFLSLILWGWIWGIPGIFLAVPIMSAIKIVCDNIPALGAIAEFLGR